MRYLSVVTALKKSFHVSVLHLTIYFDHLFSSLLLFVANPKPVISPAPFTTLSFNSVSAIFYLFFSSLPSLANSANVWSGEIFHLRNWNESLALSNQTWTACSYLWGMPMGCFFPPPFFNRHASTQHLQLFQGHLHRVEKHYKCCQCIAKEIKLTFDVNRAITNSARCPLYSSVALEALSYSEKEGHK